MNRHKGFHLIKYALLSTPFRNLALIIKDLSKPADYLAHDVWGTTPVTFIGKVPEADVWRHYAGIDVFLAPSVWPEGFGLVTREALVCGCWVVASDRGAVGDPVVEGKNGFVVDVSSVAGLINAFKEIDANPQRYTRSPEYVSELRKSEDQADDYAKIYSEVLNESRVSRHAELVLQL